MAELKTKPNDQSVAAFLDGVADERKRQDCYTILDLMKQATDAAEDMIKYLTQRYNRARQSQITTELLDIMGGAEALT